MARVLNLSFNDAHFLFGIKKLDRKKLYGFTATTVTDEKGSKCELATVSDDGRHILSKGCVAYTSLNAMNEYIPSASIKMVDKDGKPIEKILSSFDRDEIDMKVGALDDYLQLAVKSVYQMEPVEEGDFTTLMSILKKEQLLHFKFNYRTDYDDDDAFLLQSDDAIFMVIGQISPFEFIGLEKVVKEIDDVEEGDDDDFDFGML